LPKITKTINADNKDATHLFFSGEATVAPSRSLAYA